MPQVCGSRSSRPLGVATISPNASPSLLVFDGRAAHVRIAAVPFAPPYVCNGSSPVHRSAIQRGTKCQVRTTRRPGSSALARFGPFSKPSWNVRCLRILAIASRSPNGRNPPNYDVHGRDPRCPVNVETSQADWVLTLCSGVISVRTHLSRVLGWGLCINDNGTLIAGRGRHGHEEL